MEASSAGFNQPVFNQPFLVLPELWHDTIPHMSYRDLVNVYLIAKFKDIETNLDNFSVAKRIWCKQVSVITFIDTIYHAYTKKADDAFMSLVSTRHDSVEDGEKVDDKLKEELLNLFEHLDLDQLEYFDPDNPEHLEKFVILEKIVIVAAKMKYVEVFEKLKDTKVFDQTIKSILHRANDNDYTSLDPDSETKKSRQNKILCALVEFNTEVMVNVLTQISTFPNFHTYWCECHDLVCTKDYYQERLKKIEFLMPYDTEVMIYLREKANRRAELL